MIDIETRKVQDPGSIMNKKVLDTNTNIKNNTNNIKNNNNNIKNNNNNNNNNMTTMMPFVSALPLRIPLPQNDLAAMLATWMDTTTTAELGSLLSSANCQQDLETIGNLRTEIGNLLMETNGLVDIDVDVDIDIDNDSSSLLHELSEKLVRYYHYLLECEKHGMILQGNNNNNNNNNNKPRRPWPIQDWGNP